MMLLRKCAPIAFTVALAALPVVATAAPVTFFGEDLGLGENTRLLAHPNSDAARASFLSNLIGVGTETFESFADNTPTPLALNFPGAGTATLSGGSGYVETVPAGTNGFGRYPISGDKYFDTDSSFSIAFSNPIAAFGFYGVDIGDFSGQVTLQLQNGGVTNLVIPHTVNGPGGSVLFFGFYDTVNQYTGIMFGNSAGGVDGFAFDDMTIGSLEQVNPVPEPASLLLLTTGLAGAAGFRLRRKNAA